MGKQLNLEEVRKIIKTKIKEEFIFLDSDNMPIEKDDEKDILIKDCLKKGKIRLKSLNLTTILNGSGKSINEKKEEINFSKYEIKEYSDKLTIYNYSKVERISPYELVYQYYYDQFDINDYQNAYIVFFCGETGNGKTTAINALFNIIKGIELNDNYRFILIKQKINEKGEKELQTDGIHLYYLRDYNNRPIIIIDSQGYGDIRWKKYCEKIHEAFNYIFSNIIDHINTVCLVTKSSTNRIDILIRYIFGQITNLFSEDISENGIVLATFANEDTFINGPDFIDLGKTDFDFLYTQTMDSKNWWYAFDSKSVIYDSDSILAKFSFQDLLDFYQEKIFALKPKKINKYSEVIIEKKQYKIHFNYLVGIFENLIVEQ